MDQGEAAPGEKSGDKHEDEHYVIGHHAQKLLGEESARSVFERSAVPDGVDRKVLLHVLDECEHLGVAARIVVFAALCASHERELYGPGVALVPLIWAIELI